MAEKKFYELAGIKDDEWVKALEVEPSNVHCLYRRGKREIVCLIEKIKDKELLIRIKDVRPFQNQLVHMNIGPLD